MSVRKVLRAAVERVESIFDAAFTPALNPLYHLGSLGWFFFWIVAVSGIYVYIFFDTGVHDAYASVEYITHVQWYAAGVMRSLHRYASDALVLVVVLHLLREYIMERFRGVRWFAWVTGVPLIWLIYASGVSGYWLVWDKLAQYVAIMTSEWLDALPFFGESIASNFVHPSALSDRFFTLVVFIHIVVPLFLLLLMWVHIQRHAYAKANPPRLLAAGSFSALLVLSFVFPALSQGPADLTIVPAEVGIDWFYLPLYPLLDHVSGKTMWLALGGATVLLMALPWIGRRRPGDKARVNPANCNGCSWCAEDCPFTAITMVPRQDDSPYSQLPCVDESRCTGCGICAGACPTATPFSRREEQSPGIGLAQSPLAVLRETILSQCAPLTGNSRVAVFGCGHGLNGAYLANESTTFIALSCIAQLPPSFIDFLISRDHVDGVMLTGCRDGDCHYRLGQQWVRGRIAAERDPRLRQRIPRERVEVLFAGADQSGLEQQVLSDFRRRLSAMGPYQSRTAPQSRRPPADAKEEILTNA